MSISAGWLVLAVLALRLILKKAPKWVNVLLWDIVAARLLCPFAVESELILTDILINLEYDPALVCKCLPDLYVETEFGTTYGVSWSGYARCDEGQANLMEEQLDQIRSIVDNQT